MTEQRVEYHLDGEDNQNRTPSKSGTAQERFARDIAAWFAANPEWFASLLNESQAGAIVKAIKATYPGLK